MTEERRRILDMLSEGKVTVEEAERLLEALQGARRETHKKSRINAPLSPIPGVEALQDTLGGLEESLSEWSEDDNGDRDEDDKTSMRDDTFVVGDNPRRPTGESAARCRALSQQSRSATSSKER